MVDRQTRCILGWAVVWMHTQEALQQVVDQAPKAQWYHSDAFDAYQWLWYHLGRYEVSPGKAEPTMPSCAAIWLAWLANHVAFLAVPWRWNVRCDCSCIASTADNSTSSVSPTMRRTLWISLAHNFRHSLQSLIIPRGGD